MPWNHNTHYHSLLLSLVPPTARTALDAGCGHGAFAQLLARRGLSVDGIDYDPKAIARAQAEHAAPNLRFRNCSFVAPDCISATYDVVTCIAALHHVDTAQGLAALRRAVRPGGTLLILGLYREAAPADFVMSALAAPINYALSRHHEREHDAVLTTAARDTLRDIRKTANTLLAGATIRRLLLWRYLLAWQAPNGAV